VSIIPSENTSAEAPQEKMRHAVFIIHGHDNAAKHEIARFIESIGLHAVILDEQPSQGKTIIEKFESHSDVGFSIALLTPNDVGSSKGEPRDEEKYRARQNVIFELGYFMGKIGRGRVCLMQKGDIEFPYDLEGIIYLVIDESERWKLELLKEIKAVGLPTKL
jgi:predicted nucleotide-binding protein